MQTLSTTATLRALIAQWRDQGLRVALVPTMGNLHAGHFSLIELAKKHSDRVVASIFVNPTQFGPNEDYGRYPRTLEADQSGLADAGCDALFAPTVEEMYPFGVAGNVLVRVPELTEELDGAARPGHFDGVATVVLRLFNMVQPDVAVFGKKDFQQLRVIQYLVRELSLPVRILSAPIARADDGLALSSRNQYLSESERRVAPKLYAALRAMQESLGAGKAIHIIENEAKSWLSSQGFQVDYVEFRRVEDLKRPNLQERDALIALLAAKLGNTRLIDNLEMDV